MLSRSAWWGSAAATGCGSSTGRQGVTGRRWFPGVVPWLRGPPGCNGTLASLNSTWHQSLQQQRHLRWASDPYQGSATSSTSPSPRSTMPLDDWPRGSAAQSTTWHSDSCTPHEDHAATHVVVPHRSCRCTGRWCIFYCEGLENGKRPHPWWSGWWSWWEVHFGSSSIKHTATAIDQGEWRK
jgi:hypothetical protein